MERTAQARRIHDVRGAVAALALLVALLLAPAAQGASIAGCPTFPQDNPWNQRVDQLPVARNSATLIAAIGLDRPVHADFGSGSFDGETIGIPYVVVRGSRAPHVRPRFLYSDESDRGPYPLPPSAPIEGGRNADGDRHVIVVDRETCKLYELFDAHPHGVHSWSAGSGAIWSLRSNRLRPSGWTSADAAGLPILPGLARWDEVAAGAIRHALRFTAPRTRDAFVYPARHAAGDGSSPSLPPMGSRVRLKRGVSLRGLPRQARIVAQAMKTYGLLLADNGSPWFVSGAPDRHWSNDDLHALGRLRGSDFEVVDTSSLPRPR
jgi:hypothetical protein